MLEITDSNFQREVLKNSGPVVVDISTAWCGPCKILSPVVEELANEYNGRIKIGKLDADANPDVPARYNVLSVPTLLFFKNGQLVDTQIGLIPKEGLKEKLDLIL